VNTIQSRKKKEKILEQLEQYQVELNKNNYAQATLIALDIAILTKELRDHKWD